ncbi:hypothetical protein KHC28_18900 [Ancylobacter sonchi]|uniref:hypothetical protein n=1 Tax=Ancylobacter sonchi TaxID=1937790 RepID=UPI001BD6A7EB|nr:hypothetical protein [Ancylobacter sonchi]MBS7535727.1 hypothetical protein [Ancylobacter sonchi]
MKERLDYWCRAVLHRVELLILANGARLSSRMVHISRVECDFLDHTSDAIHTRRDTQRLKRDDYDEIITSLVGRAGSMHLNHMASVACAATTCASPISAGRSSRYARAIRTSR